MWVKAKGLEESSVSERLEDDSRGKGRDSPVEREWGKNRYDYRLRKRGSRTFSGGIYMKIALAKEEGNLPEEQYYKPLWPPSLWGQT